MTKGSIRSILLVLIGILAIILALACFGKDTGVFTNSISYGGDAYTGIQNAAARTGNNVQDLAKIVKFGFGSILLISGLVLIVEGWANSQQDIKKLMKDVSEFVAMKAAKEPEKAVEATETDSKKEE